MSAIVLPIRFTITGGPLIHTGEITGITTGQAVSGKAIDIFTSFKNTGNHHFNIIGKVEIKDPQGKLVDTLHINALSPIPTETKKIKTTFISSEELPPGKYSINSILSLEDGTKIAESSGSFQLEKPYVPPPPPASIVLKPSTNDTLRTDDGRITIGFPQERLPARLKVSLQNYPIEQLPAPPPGYKPATTCFRVDGLNGLLAKQATVTVKYSSADLEKAGGNASGLSLARWDEASSQWVCLKPR